jgi:hypothetical protein
MTCWSCRWSLIRRCVFSFSTNWVGINVCKSNITNVATMRIFEVKCDELQAYEVHVDLRSPSQTVQNEGRKFNSIQFIDPHAVRSGASLNISTNIWIHKYIAATQSHKHKQERTKLIGKMSQLPSEIFTSSNKVPIQKRSLFFEHSANWGKLLN